MMALTTLADRLTDFELGDLDDDQALDLFSELVTSGLAWSLQGSYGRTAQSLIDEGYLSEFGDRIDRVVEGEVASDE